MSAAVDVDVAVVGGGLAGLAAAYRLRHRRVVVLEAEARAGGRLLSSPRPPYWLNFGAHMFGGPGTVIGDLVAELGLETRPIRGRLLGMAYGGRTLLRAPLESYPLLLPLALPARLSLIRMGLALRLGSERAVAVLRERAGESAAARRARLFAFEDGRTLSDLIGRLHPEVAAILAAITERNGADPAEMSAGHGLRSFANVWSPHAPGRNLMGGSARLPEVLAARLGSQMLLGAAVAEVVPAPEGDAALVRYGRNGVAATLRARQVILATPAFVTARLAPALPEATRAALGRVRYGAFFAAALLTGETGPMPWDGNYAISTPGLSFSVLFNQATTLRVGPRQPGGSLMLFRGARGAARLLAEDDATIESTLLADLERAFPGARDLVREIALQRWPAGAPYAFPGRAALQPALTADLGRLHLAGDYLEFPNMEAAAATGVEAAARVEAALADHARSNTAS